MSADLAEAAAGADVAGAIAHFREHGWARLGLAASEAALERLRARADDIMMGRVVHEGLFFQRDSESGRYEDLVFGRGWEGPSPEYRKIEKLELDPLFRAWLENPLFERVARAVLGDAVAVYRATLFTKGDERRHRAPVAPGRRELLGPRPGSRAPDLDGARRRARGGRLRRGRRRQPHGRPGDPARRHHPSTRRGRARGRRPEPPAARPRGRGAPAPQLPLAPLGPELDGPPAAGLHGLVPLRGDPLHSHAASPPLVPARLRA